MILLLQTPIDGYLFMIKYLLIVREQITPFHIDTTIKEVYLDFTRTKCDYPKVYFSF